MHLAIFKFIEYIMYKQFILSFILSEFQKLIVRSNKNSILRLKDIGTVELGTENYNSSVTFDGKKAVFLAITPTPLANPLTVIGAARKIFPSIQKQFPPSLTGSIVYDATDYIRASIWEVTETIAEAALIVIVVIFLFLASLRTVLIPIVAIPLSLIGAFLAYRVTGRKIIQSSAGKCHIFSTCRRLAS